MDSSLRHRVQTVAGAHSASYPMATEISFSVEKRPSSAKDRNAWSYNPSSPYVSIAWRLIKQRGNFTLQLN